MTFFGATGTSCHSHFPFAGCGAVRVPGPGGGPSPSLTAAHVCRFGLVDSSGEVGEGLGLEAPPTLTLPLGWFTDGVPLGRGPAWTRSHPSGLGPQAALRYLASGVSLFV